MRQHLKRIWLLLSLLSTAASAQGQIGYIENPPWLVSSAAPPTGILPDLAALLFVEVPMPSVLVLPPRRLRAEMTAGTLQWTFWPCHLAPNSYHNLGTFMKDAFGYAVRADAGIHQHRDLQGKAVGVWASRLGLMPALEQDRTIIKSEFNSIESALMMLKSGRLDAVVTGHAVFRWQLKRDPLLAEKLSYVPQVELAHCLFAHPSVSADDRERISQRLQRIVQQGLIEAVVERQLAAPTP